MEAKDTNSERPPDSDFQQQNLKAWQPLLTPGWVIGTFAVIGFCFMPIGILILKASEDVYQREVRYDLSVPVTKNSSVTIAIDEDIEPPIFFYYKLTNFYQNHRRYVKSRNDAQLRGEAVADLSSCDPLESFEGKQLYPCGLIANSYFNDKFNSPVIVRNGSSIPLAWTDKGIAWESDVDKKFKPFRSDFDPKTMTKVGPRKFELPDPSQEDFIVWMRTAGLPTFKKLRYIIKDQSLKKGDEIKIDVQSEFDVSTFNGQKHVVISTTSWLGGKNDFLGYAYIVVASLCLLLALVFFVKHRVSPRPLGDMRYFNWHGPKPDSNN